MTQKIDVEHFGLSIFEYDEFINHPKYQDYLNLSEDELTQLRNCYYGNKNYWRLEFNGVRPIHVSKLDKYERKSEADRKSWYCYFVLDLGKLTDKPILFWSKKYLNRGTVEKMKEVCVNGGLALLNKNKMGSYSSISNAEKVMTELKLKFFGAKPIPIKLLTEHEWKSRFSKIKSNQNRVMDL